ncbi:putative oxidoreductase C-terminal domain-containing protein [Natronoflexus pectinivorans]|uniref:Oxidoreductase family protein n=1 Tax=Natronoflexus pectinivorans TaxID=682526 RepID=A0A4R2GHZ9_9BACT|nr:putative oxidoreductase C-terminal domain-containing protein [Natronoflexus pectinivorans]TCO07772.1 oxidoreductase family protein [Natronoflexus pectinivorans]
MRLIIGLSTVLMMHLSSCQQPSEEGFTGADNEVKLITLNPGHFHAALIQKEMYSQVDPTVHVYAPGGPDLDLHMQRINGFNNRSEDPTSWESLIYTGPDYLEKMLSERKGNVVVLAGNNKLKTSYIKTAVENGFNVLSDKPMVIDGASFEMLEEAFQIAKQNDVLLYDIMTERYEITGQLQRAIGLVPEIFGTMEKGSPENPAVVKESVHHFFKYVAGSVLRRPPWYFDVSQQGEGIIDVTTHLVDLIQWICFPDVILNYKSDVNVYDARRWPTNVSRQQFLDVTGLQEVPDYMKSDFNDNDVLEVFANGEMSYELKDVHARVSVIWDYEAPEGGGDTHVSLMRGSKSNLIIRQGAEQNFIPMLYIEPAPGQSFTSWKPEVRNGFEKITNQFPGVELVFEGSEFRVEIPNHYRIGHEAHFGRVAEKYLGFLVDGKLPDWEVPNMLTKYYTTTRALEMARERD